MEIKSQHTRIDIVTRSKGHSVMAKAAYNARDRLNDEYYGKVHDYSKKDDLVFSKIFLPKHIPKKFEDREFLWNEVERIEKSKNSQLARNLIFAIPRELNSDDRINLINDFVEENFTSKGMIADVNIYNSTASDNEEQPHAHILLTLREIDEKGNFKAKSKKEYILDENGEKIRLPSGNFKSRKVNMNNWNDKDNAILWRENFSKKANEYLENNNIDKRIDHRTFKEQGRKELPQIHLGTASWQMEKKGIKTERGNINRQIIKINNEYKKLKNELSNIGSWINDFIEKVKSSIKKLSSENQKEYINEPTLFDVYSYIDIYSKIQKEKSNQLSDKDRDRKNHFDTKKNLKTLSYMKTNNLKTIIDVQMKKDEVLNSLNVNKENLNSLNSKLKNIETVKRQIEIISENRSIYKKYESMENSFFAKLSRTSKDDFYIEHKKEIDKYLRAVSILNKEKRADKPTLKSLDNEKKEILSKINLLETKQKKIQEEIKQINHIKYLVDEVNNDFGIDINIEIEMEYEKAIARGEQPTTRMRIDLFKRENKKEEYKKQKTREYYKKKENDR